MVATTGVCKQSCELQKHRARALWYLGATRSPRPTSALVPLRGLKVLRVNAIVSMQQSNLDKDLVDGETSEASALTKRGFQRSRDQQSVRFVSAADLQMNAG